MKPKKLCCPCYIIVIPGIEAFSSDQLRHAETKEKISLPGAEEIQTERTILGLLQGVADFEADTLRTVKTREPASPSSIVKVRLNINFSSYESKV